MFVIAIVIILGDDTNLSLNPGVFDAPAIRRQCYRDKSVDSQQESEATRNGECDGLRAFGNRYEFFCFTV